jgi:hypothetical protein
MQYSGMSEPELAMIELARQILKGMISFTFLWVLAEYLWEHRAEFKENWKKY